MIKMMSEKGCILEPRKQVGEFFTRQSANDDFCLKPNYANPIDMKHVKLFESMYNYYHRNRHPYMHASDIDATTAVINSFDDAVNKLDEIYHKMQSFYDIHLISEDLKKHIRQGSYILFDLLLSNGDNFNRFAEAKYDGNEINRRELTITTIPENEVKELNLYYHGKTKELSRSVLTRKE